MFKQLIIARKDLNMSPGKLAAQVSHASIAFLIEKLYWGSNNLIKLIEFDGEQHYKPVDYFGGQEQFERQKDRDKKKDEYCLNHNIKLQRISYQDYDKINLDMLLS